MAKKNKAWFVRIGPFGGLFPRSWEGFLVLIIGVSIVVALGIYSDHLGKLGDVANSQKVGLAAIVSGIVLYIFAAAKSSRPGN